MNMTIRRVVLVLTGLMVAASATAEFRVIGKDGRPEHMANAADLPGSGCFVGLSWAGPTPANSESRLTEGDRLPLDVALRGLVPASWTVSFEPPEIAKRTVSWRHIGSRQAGLDAVLRQGMACGVATAATKRLAVSDGRREPLPSVQTGVAPLVDRSSQDYDRNTGMGRAGPMTAGVSGGYEVRAGDTVRETLRRWAGATGWQVIWDASRDYTIEVSYRFDINDDFPAAAKALLDSYWRQGKPVKASMYANKVLRVEDAQ